MSKKKEERREKKGLCEEKLRRSDRRSSHRVPNQKRGGEIRKLFKKAGGEIFIKHEKR